MIEKHTHSFIWQTNKYMYWFVINFLVFLEGEKVQNIFFFILESGCLYTFGANGDGQLGVEDIPSSNCPVKVECEPRQYKALAAGADHSVALTGM